MVRDGTPALADVGWRCGLADAAGEEYKPVTRSLTPEDEARLEEFLRPPWIAVVATLSPGGMPQLTPNWYLFANGRLAISTTRERVKYRNLSRDQRLAVCVCSEPRAAQYATLTGWAEIIDDDSIWPETQAIVERYVAPELVDAHIRELRTQYRVIISVSPDRVIFRS